MARLKITRTCKTCGITFRPHHQGRPGIYCSVACYRNKSPESRFWAKVAKTDDCWLWQGTTASDGYGVFGIKGRYLKAHRMSYALAYGPIPDGLLVCHRCDVRACVRPDHLFLGTNDDNSKDMVAKGRSPRGEQVTIAALTEPTVREARALYQQGFQCSVLARKYHVNWSTMYRALTRQYWKHVE